MPYDDYAGVSSPLRDGSETRPYSETIQFFRVQDPEKFVILYINPRRLQIRSSKIINKVQTATRWVFQYWGTDVYTVRYEGVTGYINVWDAQQYHLMRKGEDPLRNPAPQPPTVPVLSPYDTPAYIALEKLRTFYEEPDITQLNLASLSTQTAQDAILKLRVGMRYREELFVGHFLVFDFEEVEDSPWQWSYSMEFQADYRCKKGSWGELQLLAALRLQDIPAVDQNFAVGIDLVRQTYQRRTYAVAAIDNRKLYLHGVLGEYKVLFKVEAISDSNPSVSVRGVVKEQVQLHAKSGQDPTGEDPNMAAIVSGYGPYTLIMCEGRVPVGMTVGSRVRIREISSDYVGGPAPLGEGRLPPGHLEQFGEPL